VPPAQPIAVTHACHRGDELAFPLAFPRSSYFIHHPLLSGNLREFAVAQVDQREVS
jgi:hypothetical protein